MSDPGYGREPGSAAPPFGGYGPPPGAGASPPPGYGYPPPGWGPPPYGAPGYGFPPPGYGFPPPGYGGYPPPRRTNGLAIGSLVLGLLGIVGCQVFGIPGVILGFVARRQIRDRGEEGAGLALAGIITSAIACFLLVALVAFYGTMVAWLGTTGTSGSGSGTFRVPSTLSRSPATTERIGGGPGTQVPGPGPRITAAPSGLLPLEACPRVTLAVKNLEWPQDLDNAILTDAARTLHLELPASFADDIDTLFADALTRVDLDFMRGPSGDAVAADQRIATAIGDACPG